MTVSRVQIKFLLVCSISSGVLYISIFFSPTGDIHFLKNPSVEAVFATVLKDNCGQAPQQALPAIYHLSSFGNLMEQNNNSTTSQQKGYVPIIYGSGGILIKDGIKFTDNQSYLDFWNLFTCLSWHVTSFCLMFWRGRCINNILGYSTGLQTPMYWGLFHMAA